MRILAVSDTHDRVEAVRELRRRESGLFDLVTLTGDIGDTHFDEILGTLASFGPVAYVLGNWDRNLRGRAAPPGCRWVHCAPVAVAGWSVVGLDMPFMDDADDRERLARIVSEGSPRRTIVLSHDRLTKVADDLGPVPLFVFGHFHRHKVTRFRGATFVNVGALGEVVTVRPAGGKYHPDTLRNAITATYCTIDLAPTGAPTISPRRFEQDLTGWEPLVNEKWPFAAALDASFLTVD